MPDDREIIGYRAIRRIATGEICSPLVPVYADDWPYGAVARGQFLLRYLDMWKFEDLLTTRTLYFCRADKFPDQLEGTLSPEGVHGTSPSDEVFLKSVPLNYGSYEERARYRQVARECTFVSCWHINDRESQAMWDAYTKSSDSVVVITTAERLANALRIRAFGAAVRYVAADTPRTEFDERSLFYYKDQSYSFEQEFRLTVDLMTLGGTVRADHPDDFSRRIPVDLDTLVYGVQPHPRVSKVTEERIRTLVRAHFPKAIEQKKTEG